MLLFLTPDARSRFLMLKDSARNENQEFGTGFAKLLNMLNSKNSDEKEVAQRILEIKRASGNEITDTTQLD